MDSRSVPLMHHDPSVLTDPRGGSMGRVQGVDTPPPPEMTCGFLIQLVFCKKKMWCIGVEVEQETSAPPPKKNPGSALDPDLDQPKGNVLYC